MLIFPSELTDMRNGFVLFSILTIVGIALISYFVSTSWLWLFVFFGPLLFIGFYDYFQSKHSIMRNFPILGRGRYVAESLRPKIYQYFIESNTDGKPFSKIHRDIIYQRSKKALDTTPFGTQLDVYGDGYEWMNHSIAAIDPHVLNQNPRVKVGNTANSQVYSASLFNVSAMSFGSLSSRAILSLNGGAKIGDFAHNTGEGGISPYHLKPQGDLIYQIGTGYFGARTNDGNFSPELFKERTAEPSVKMIEIKLSQGAKPGHGGILPGKKATEEIAKIRNIEPYKDVLSPPFHKAFSTPIGLIQFVKQCRELANGKPVGFKLCIGQKSEFVAICKAMIKLDTYPDFISVDGGEGGTGAAPLEFSNSIGMPYIEGLAFAYDTLIGFNIKKKIKLFASGKITSGFDIFRAISLGADATYSARAMMMALGCIQALECNKNNCPTGVATQKKDLVAGLDVEDKTVRVANYHHETVKAFVEIMAAAGIQDPDQINRSHISRRLNNNVARTYAEIYPYIPEGCLLKHDSIPENWRAIMSMADPDSFQAKFVEVFIEED